MTDFTPRGKAIDLNEFNVDMMPDAIEEYHIYYEE